jgi:hypothetical protein
MEKVIKLGQINVDHKLHQSLNLKAPNFLKSDEIDQDYHSHHLHNLGAKNPVTKAEFNNFIELGQIIPKNHEEIVKEISFLYDLKCKLKVFYIQTHTEDLSSEDRYEIRKNSLPQAYKNYFITFEEYQLIFKDVFDFDKNLNDDMKIKDLPRSEWEAEEFKKLYTNDINGYLKLLSRQNNRLKDYIFSKQNIYLSLDYLNRSTYITGKAGSGKSELLKLLIDSAVKSKQYCVIVIDPHGDLIDESLELIEDKDDVVLIDPSLDDYKIPTINPFDISDRSNSKLIDNTTQAIIESIKLILGSEFSDNMEALLVPCIAILLKEENSSLFDLYRFLDDTNNEDLIELGLKSNYEVYRDFFKNQFTEKDKARTKIALHTRLQLLLNNPTFANMITGKSSINLEELMNTQGKTIFFRLSKSKMKGTLEAYGIFITNLLQSYALNREDIDKDKRVKTLLFIDEVQNFLSPNIDEILSESRKYKLFITASHQYINQLETKLKETLLSNTNLKIVGINNNTTYTTLAKELNCKVDDLNELYVTGEFYIRVANSPAFKFFANSKLVDFRIEYDKDEFIKNQLSKYYRAINTTVDNEAIEEEHTTTEDENIGADTTVASDTSTTIACEVVETKATVVSEKLTPDLFNKNVHPLKTKDDNLLFLSNTDIGEF